MIIKIIEDHNNHKNPCPIKLAVIEVLPGFSSLKITIHQQNWFYFIGKYIFFVWIYNAGRIQAAKRIISTFEFLSIIIKEIIMKTKPLIVLILLIVCPLLFAQEETLLGSGEISNGGFGGPVVKFTSINKHFGVLVGGQGGWIINHTFVIGGGGYGLVNNVKTESSFLGERQLLNFGYGGVELHYIGNSDKLIHYTISLLIGAGGIGYRHPDNWEWDWDTNTQSFFVMEPTIRAMLNVTSFFRIGIGGGYRLVSGVNLDDLKDSEISGPSAEIVLKFGKF